MLTGVKIGGKQGYLQFPDLLREKDQQIEQLVCSKSSWERKNLQLKRTNHLEKGDTLL